MGRKAPRKPKAPKAPKDTRFEFAGTPGAMCPLVNDLGSTVRCTVWPQTLLDMLWAGALRGEAHEYAARLAQTGVDSGLEEGQVPPGAVRADAGPVSQDGIRAKGALQDLPEAAEAGRGAALCGP